MLRNHKDWNMRWTNICRRAHNWQISISSTNPEINALNFRTGFRLFHFSLTPAIRSKAVPLQMKHLKEQCCHFLIKLRFFIRCFPPACTQWQSSKNNYYRRPAPAPGHKPWHTSLALPDFFLIQCQIWYFRFLCSSSSGGRWHACSCRHGLKQRANETRGDGKHELGYFSLGVMKNLKQI